MLIQEKMPFLFIPAFPNVLALQKMHLVHAALLLAARTTILLQLIIFLGLYARYGRSNIILYLFWASDLDGKGLFFIIFGSRSGENF